MMRYDPNRERREIEWNWKKRIKYFFIFIAIGVGIIVLFTTISEVYYRIKVPEEARECSLWSEALSEWIYEFGLL